MFIDPRKRGRERARETFIGCLPYAPWPGIEPTTFRCMEVIKLRSNLLQYNVLSKNDLHIYLCTVTYIESDMTDFKETHKKIYSRYFFM